MEDLPVSTKQPAKTVTKEQPFTKPGECLDEVTFKFDDGSTLYVSENFLRYVSPVFKAMFEPNWKEKITRTVDLKGKVFDEFLEFLLCLHPCVQKPVDERNVLQLVKIAEEYQTTFIIEKCKKVMETLLESNIEWSFPFCRPDNLYMLRRARSCLKILTTAKSLEYEEIITNACKTIGCFGHAIFTGTVTKGEVYPNKNFQKRENEDPIEDCRKLFEELSDALKNELLLQRLRRCDNLEMLK